jgi:cellulose binding protein with CBM2 domain
MTRRANLVIQSKRWFFFVALLILAGLSILLIPLLSSSTHPAAVSKSTPSPSFMKAHNSNANPYVVRTPPPPPSCTARMQIDHASSKGFQATVTVKNTSRETLNTWMIYWTLPAGVYLVRGWNANVFKDGDVIMAHPFDNSRSFPAGSVKIVGFEATGPANPPPHGVTLNGILCTSE